VARREDGEIFFDPTGSGPGRGAYVHRDEACIRRAVRTGSIARALRTTKEAGQAGRLISEGMEMRSEH
jgi:predicted RNA-binding protein YlxR (DUF448 family)